MSTPIYPRPVRLLAIFLFLAGLPFIALGWLGTRLLEQDRALESQRERDRLDGAASLIAQRLERRLASWSDQLSETVREPHIALPSGAVMVVAERAGVVRSEGVRLPFYPHVPLPTLDDSSAFATAEASEFQHGDGVKAGAIYRQLAASGTGPVRAGALVRLARVLRSRHDIRGALNIYDRLAELGELPVPGGPAQLLALREHIALLRLTGDERSASREQVTLGSLLAEGRFTIDRPTFEFFADSATMPAETPHRVLALALDHFWPMLLDQPSGRAGWSDATGAYVALWRRAESGTSAIVTSIDALDAAAASGSGIRAALKDEAGRTVWGSIPGNTVSLTRTSRETGLPWSIQVSDSAVDGAAAAISMRQSLMLSGFLLMALVIAAAGYFVFRSVSRELGVARLQSDFVSAVSHEFRTPLTAMRHLTDMLDKGTAAPERLPLYYRALGKETRRLQDMVENLLDFGRIEAGRQTFQMEDADPVELARRVIGEFPDAAQQRLKLEAWSAPLNVRADRHALTLALRNLVDNAIKYSPEESTISIAVESHDGMAGISVQDQGPGIPKEEHRHVFRKFARGSSARLLNVKGTGLGLAMAEQIVRSHGGKLELTSGPGQGSRFTIFLPVEVQRA